METKMHVGLSYKSIEAKRLSPANGSINISNNSTVTDVSEADGKLVVGFAFTSKYEPNVGLIQIVGEITLSETKDNIKRAITEWKKSDKKNLPEDIAEKVHNAILPNCMVEATILSRDIQLPAPIPVPQVTMGKKKTNEDTNIYIR